MAEKEFPDDIVAPSISEMTDRLMKLAVENDCLKKKTANFQTEIDQLKTREKDLTREVIKANKLQRETRDQCQNKIDAYDQIRKNSIRDAHAVVLEMRFEDLKKNLALQIKTSLSQGVNPAKIAAVLSGHLTYVASKIQ